MITITDDILSKLHQTESVSIKFDGPITTLNVSQRIHEKEVFTDYTYHAPEVYRQSGSWVILYLNGDKGHAQDNIVFFFNHLKVGDKIKFYARRNDTKPLREIGFETAELVAQVSSYKQNGVSIDKIHTIVLDTQTVASNANSKNIKIFG